MSGWGDDDGRRGPVSGPSWSDRLAANIQKINASVLSLKRSVESLGTARDNAPFRERMRSLMDGTQKIIKETNEQIRVQKSADTSATGREQLRRLVEQYKTACNAFEAAAKEAATKQRQIVVELSTPREPSYMNGGSGTGGGGESMQSQEFVAVDVDLIRERNQEVEALERDLIGLHDLTVDLATMVHDQQEGIDVIEENVTSAAAAVRDGVGELKEANVQQRKARKKMCIISLCLIVVAAIIIVPSAVCGSGNC